MGNIDVYDGGSYTQYTEQIEAGGSGALICEVDEATGKLNHTFKEIVDSKNAILYFHQSGGQYSSEQYGFGNLVGAEHYNEDGQEIYQLIFVMVQGVQDDAVMGQSVMFTANSENEYPVLDNSNGGNGDGGEGV